MLLFEETAKMDPCPHSHHICYAKRGVPLKLNVLSPIVYKVGGIGGMRYATVNSQTCLTQTKVLFCIRVIRELNKTIRTNILIRRVQGSEIFLCEQTVC